MSFNVSCFPGKDATAGMVRISPELPALVLYLDPVNMAIQLPPHQAGRESLARFCRELAEGAFQLAEALDDDEPDPGPGMRLVREEPSDSGAGP